MHVRPCWQTCRFTDAGSVVKRPIPFAQTLMQDIQRTGHALARQRVHVIGLGLLEKLGHVSG